MLNDTTIIILVHFGTTWTLLSARFEILWSALCPPQTRLCGVLKHSLMVWIRCTDITYPGLHFQFWIEHVAQLNIGIVAGIVVWDEAEYRQSNEQAMLLVVSMKPQCKCKWCFGEVWRMTNTYTKYNALHLLRWHLVALYIRVLVIWHTHDIKRVAMTCCVCKVTISSPWERYWIQGFGWFYCLSCQRFIQYVPGNFLSYHKRTCIADSFC